MIRLCHPHDFDGFNYVVDGSDRLGGPLGRLLDEGIDFSREHIAARGLNLSVIIQRSKIFNVTSLKSNNYEGCLDALQSNQSDIYLGLADYPQAAENLTQGLVVLDTSLVIGSNYQKGLNETAQVLSSFACFSIPVWMMSVACLLCLSLLLKIKNSMGRARIQRNYYSFLYTVTHLIRRNPIDDKGFARKLLYLMASLYSLVVVHYFCSSIKTELVTVRDPKVFRSYQDIIDRGAAPYFGKGMSYDLLFKKPDAPSYRKKLWRHSTSIFREEELYVELDPATFLLGSLSLLKEDNVIILDSLLMSMPPATGCQFAARDPARFLSLVNNLKIQSQPILQLSKNAESTKIFTQRFFERYPNFHYDSVPDFNFFTSVDPNEKYYLLGIIMSEHLADKLEGMIRKFFMTTIESGLTKMMRDKLKNFNMLKSFEFEMQLIFGKKDRSRSHLIQECASCKIIKPEVGYHPLQLKNFHSLLHLVIAIVPFLFLVLAVEKVGYGIKFNGRSITIDRTARKRKRILIVTSVTITKSPAHAPYRLKVTPSARMQNRAQVRIRARRLSV